MSDSSDVDGRSRSRRKPADDVPAVEEIPAVKETYLDEDVVVRFKNPDDAKPEPV